MTRCFASLVAGAVLAISVSLPASAQHVTKKGWVVSKRFADALKKAPPQEWLNPKTGKPYASWKVALDEADDLEDGDDEDEDGNVVPAKRALRKPKELLAALHDLDEYAERNGTNLRGHVVRRWMHPTTENKIKVQHLEHENFLKNHKVILGHPDDNTDDDDDDDKALKRQLRRLEDRSAFFTPIDSNNKMRDLWWLRSASRKAMEETEEAKKRRIEKAKRNLKCTRENKECYPKNDSDWVPFSKSMGDDDTVELWTSAVFGVKHQGADRANCQGSWDTGITVMKHKVSLFKISGELGSDSDRKAIKGQAAVYLAGKSVWSKEGEFKETFSRSYSTPKVVIYVPFFPGLAAKGSAQASATFSLTAGLDAEATNTNSAQFMKCALSFTPKASSKLVVEAGVSIGIPKLMDLAEGGVRGTLKPIAAELPVKVGVMTGKIDGIPYGGVFLRADANMTIMAGKLEAYFRIADICTPGGKVCTPGWTPFVGRKCAHIPRECLVGDVLGLPTKGAVKLWKHDGWPFHKKLIDRDAKFAWVTKEEQKKVAKP